MAGKLSVVKIMHVIRRVRGARMLAWTLGCRKPSGQHFFDVLIGTRGTLK